MANIPKLENDLSVISKLSDRPNEQGVDTTELKKRFDSAENQIKEYLNTVLIPGVEGGGQRHCGGCASTASPARRPRVWSIAAANQQNRRSTENGGVSRGSAET